MDNNLILKRFFSKTMLHNLLSHKHNDIFNSVIKRYIRNYEGKDFETLISEIYTYIGKSYRTEYFYKNTILNKLLFKKHDYRKTVVLTELPIGKSKADLVMINGKGVVYEIKSELDNLDRLNSQIADYYKAFNEVFIVTYDANIEKVVTSVSNSVGIICLTKRGALNIIRNSLTKSDNLDYRTIFKILRKSEFENILELKGVILPKVSAFNYYKECYKALLTINILELQGLMLKELKHRMRIEQVEYCVKTPKELRFLTYFDEVSAKNQDELFQILGRNYGG